MDHHHYLSQFTSVTLSKRLENPNQVREVAHDQSTRILLYGIHRHFDKTFVDNLSIQVLLILRLPDRPSKLEFLRK